MGLYRSSRIAAYDIPYSCTQQMLSSPYLYEHLEKKGKFTGLTKQEKEGAFAILICTSEQRAMCTARAPCLASQALSFELQESLLPLVEQRARVHPLFATPLGIAAAV